MEMKKMLQGWETTLEQQARDGNADAQAILDWMKKSRWRKSQRHLPPKPFPKRKVQNV